MLLHLLYVIAFTILAVLAVGNLIRNLMTLGFESQRAGMGNSPNSGRKRMPSHPELLDAKGNVIDEPLLVMRSMSVEDARERLDAIFEASPSPSNETREES
ncbi:MAG TPA: DUF2973 domain-containing protein [Leptolyngbyaceae cyanobacterium M33_DOE_097]|uniref:DUF2973 domain-containing protein n=1 Tax=Oscillatoriales cyanobacterium SpSt-418 TaxID=2282169 RepID=A0A7C3KAF9_9CYAN|nr:DUF2973 domain-containing protein [Leptolyngbyaceae cyanobacterium M33_DOE_097]